SRGGGGAGRRERARSTGPPLGTCAATARNGRARWSEGEDTPTVASMGRPRSRVVGPSSAPRRSLRVMATPNLHVSTRPAAWHKRAIRREERPEPKKFREVVRELSWLLGYEALADVA